MTDYTLRITLELDITQDLIDFIDSYDIGGPSIAEDYNDIADWVADSYDNLKELMEFANDLNRLIDIPFTENYEIVPYNNI